MKIDIESKNNKVLSCFDKIVVCCSFFFSNFRSYGDNSQQMFMPKRWQNKQSINLAISIQALAIYCCSVFFSCGKAVDKYLRTWRIVSILCCQFYSCFSIIHWVDITLIAIIQLALWNHSGLEECYRLCSQQKM